MTVTVATTIVEAQFITALPITYFFCNGAAEADTLVGDAVIAAIAASTAAAKLSLATASAFAAWTFNRPARATAASLADRATGSFAIPFVWAALSSACASARDASF